ncbi:uncharacterized protein [Antedon mediterranea]|uniref:uncharacterized protein n=1 Tax=Antedon mediterranea TaxID=105859 RepID=UPI003AF7AE71
MSSDKTIDNSVKHDVVQENNVAHNDLQLQSAEDTTSTSMTGDDEITNLDDSTTPTDDSDSSPGVEEITVTKTDVDRSELFTQGRDLEKEGKPEEALKLYLQSLTGIQEQVTYPELPQCLHQVSQIYFAKNEYEKAVHFIQAEKMYYETALIDAAKLHLQFKNAQDGTTSDTAETSQKAMKATQFEKLARLCKAEGNPYLALDYCGKATKMYRSLYGEEHPTTKQALDLFTIIYADVGKKQYAEAMERSQNEEDSSETVHTILPRLSGDGDIIAPKATLKKRSSFDSKDKADERKKKGIRKVRFEEEYEPTPIKDDHDDFVMTSLMMVLFVLCTVFILLVGSYIYCYNKTATSPMCAGLKSDLSYYFMKIQYTFKHYFQ